MNDELLNLHKQLIAVKDVQEQPYQSHCSKRHQYFMPFFVENTQQSSEKFLRGVNEIDE